MPSVRLADPIIALFRDVVHSTNRSTGRSTDESLDRLLEQSLDRSLDGLLERPLDELLDRQLERPLDRELLASSKYVPIDRFLAGIPTPTSSTLQGAGAFLAS